jgi:GMC oxidoreductase
LQGLVDIFRLEVGVVGEDLISRAACCEQPKQSRHRKPEPPDAWLSGANAGINRYSGELHGISITLPGGGEEVSRSASLFGDRHPSGVGDPERLAMIGVPVVHELRGVGKNMQDHYVARVSYPVVGAQTASAIMIAEKGATMIKGAARRRLAA